MMIMKVSSDFLIIIVGGEMHALMVMNFTLTSLSNGKVEE